MTNRGTIADPDGTLCEITGYVPSKVREGVTYLGYILTIGVLRLVFHWVPRWKLLCTCNICPMNEAERVLIKDPFGIYYTADVLISMADTEGNEIAVDKRSTADTFSQGDEEEAGDAHLIYFMYKKMKYIWIPRDGLFRPLSVWQDMTDGGLFPPRPLNQQTVSRRRRLFGSNEMRIHVTPIIKLLFSECLNPFYCFQVFSITLWMVDDYWKYATCILVVSVISLCTQIFQMRRNQRNLKSFSSSTCCITVQRSVDDKMEELSVDASALVPGDLVKIHPNGCLMHCDAFVLTGSCIVNESTLTGESVPVTKTGLPEQYRHNAEYDEHVLKRHLLYCGTTVVQTRNHAGEHVVAMVYRTGFSTTKGELLRTILFPKPAQFEFSQDAFKFIGALAIFAAIGFVISIYFMYKAGESLQTMITRPLDMVTIVVPPALPVAVTIVVVYAQRRLLKQGIYCISPSMINVCGVINLACFDKTGTLTEEGLDMWGVIPAEGNDLTTPLTNIENLDSGPLLEALAACHSLTRVEGKMSGDPLDLKMFESTGWNFIESCSEQDCIKFEMVIPAIVRPNSNAISSNAVPTVGDLTIPYEIGILRHFTFSSSLQRMSVIARILGCPHFNIYAKGSPEMIESLCRPETIPSNFHSVLLDHTREGYRVLGLAYRTLKVSYTQMMRISRSTVEKDLTFIGLLVMENRLKPQTIPVVHTLRQANIRVVMATGDNMLTAISVARDCEIIDEMDRIIIVSAKPPLEAAVPELIPSDELFVKRPSHSCETPNVEFHYAEDLHKPVTEVTATSRGVLHRGKRSDRLFNRWKHDKDVSSAVNTQSKTDEFETYMKKNDDIEMGSNESVVLQMSGKNNFHLAITGQSWAILKEHYPSLLQKLVVKGSVFARFSPDQKTQLIGALQSVGYHVTMCGDGANDCGALKAAHAGIALSEAEASVASPFTSKTQNISCVPRLIREGRCALVTSSGTFKFMAGYAMIQFFSVIILYYMGIFLSDVEFLYIDLFIITALGVSFGYTKAYPRLATRPPSVRLLSALTVFSLGMQLLIQFGFQLFIFLLVQAQPWYVDVSENFDVTSYENTVIFSVSAYQYIGLAIVFSKGAPYRRSLFSNYLFIGTIIVTTAFSLYVTVHPANPVLEYFEMIRIPAWQFVILLHVIIMCNFILAYCVELLISGSFVHRCLVSLRRAACPRLVRHKIYEQIREQIRRESHHWPPIIRSASVQSLPRDVFIDKIKPTDEMKQCGIDKHRDYEDQEE